jgi:ribosomal silencing factor RsfS
MNGPTLQSIRQRARIVIAAAGGTYAKRLSDKVGNNETIRRWTRGVVVCEPDELLDVPAIATLAAGTAHYGEDIAHAVNALRAAGWTVTDGGDVLALPAKGGEA